MAKQSSIAKLAEKPLGFQLGVLGAVIAVLGFVYFQFFLSSLNEELDSASASFQKLQKEKKKLAQRKKDWKKLISDQEEIDAVIRANKVSLPRDAALPSFLGHLQRQAAVAGVTFKKINPLEEEPVDSYVKVPVAIEITGSFHQIMRYFYLLMETKRIITVENFSIVPEKSDTDALLLKSSFRATTFRQAVSELAGDLGSPATKEKKPGSMKEQVKGARDKRESDAAKADAADKSKSGVDRLKNAGAQ